MGFRASRASQAECARTAATVVLAVGLWTAFARAAEAPDQPIAPPALSASCEAPAGDIASSAPLQQVSTALHDRKRLTVLAIGSSSTAGLGASTPSHNYPAQLESILERAFKGLDVVIVNAGVSGEVAVLTAERLKLQVALKRPDLVLWQVGTNDALERVPIEDFTATVRDTLHWLREHEVDVVLVGLQYTPRLATDPFYSEVRVALRKLATEENVLLVRRFEAMRFLEDAKNQQLMSEDDLHLNDLGYRCMAEHVARAVVLSAFRSSILRPPKAPPQ